MFLRARLRRAIAIAGAALRDPRRRGVPIAFVKPCYWVLDTLSAQSTMLDFGLGFDADFSQSMMAKYGLMSVGFDPTRKHLPALNALETQSSGRFRVIAAAIGGSAGDVEFFESKENVSGSLRDDHIALARDTVTRYAVEVLTIAQAFERAGFTTVDIVKMDIEGSEYEALEGASDDTLRAAGQWIVEFHHDLVSAAPFSRTQKIVRRFHKLGFEHFTRDNVNFLFYRR